LGHFYNAIRGQESKGGVFWDEQYPLLGGELLGNSILLYHSEQSLELFKVNKTGTTDFSSGLTVLRPKFRRLLVDGEREAKEVVDDVWVAVYLFVNHNS
jgi:hypothetical protein